MTRFQELLSQHIGASTLKQQQFGAFLGKHNWNVDMTAGTVNFDRGRVYPIQIIGTQADATQSWLWAWANEQSGIAPRLLACAQSLRALGEKEAILELSTAELDARQIDGHLLAFIASGVCEADAYYRGPYAGGAVFFTVSQTGLSSPHASAVEIINLMNSIISQFPVDHKIMARALLQCQGYQANEGTEKLTATADGRIPISVNFDELGRISSMETTKP